MFPDAGISVLQFADCPFPVVMASVSDGEFRAYARRHIVRTSGTDHTVLFREPLADGYCLPAGAGAPGGGLRGIAGTNNLTDYII